MYFQFLLSAVDRAVVIDVISFNDIIATTMIYFTSI